ncbi:transcription factor bhlh130, partial [Phtheirospermum japonicum]
GCIVGSYSVGVETQININNNNNNNNNNNGSSLVRQSSSPAGFFNGFGVMGDVGNYRSSVHNQPKPNISSANNNFSSAPSSSTRFMPTIPENGNQDIATTENEQLRNDNNNNANARDFEPVFPHDTWNESAFSNGLKRSRDVEMRMFSDFNNGETIKNSSGLVHHLSLPKTSSEMAEVEKLLQFQPETTTPCQVRAKRGCATHPRSIAERMRRTRISEKMKKPQDLFPNMDKQTSTADMLDLAVEYIKDLQKQVETLADTKAKCICSSQHQQT